MKKQNQAPIKTRRAASKTAQHKHPAPRAEVQRKTSPIEGVTYCYDATGILELKAKKGKQLSYFETQLGEEQTLCRKGRRYLVLVDRTEFLNDEGEWNLQEEYRPGVPADRLRTVIFELPVSREGAVRWLADNIIENLIPREFHRDFNRGKKSNRKPITARAILCTFLGLNSRASDAQIEAAMGKAVAK
ncbi:MAG: hypothetical protein ACR2HH_01880 [Chthoniobacterales bacterium]